MANNVFELLSAGEADAPAIVEPAGPTITYAQLREQVAHLAGQLNALGIGRNDRVAIVLPNGPEAALSFLAVAACATAAPLNQAYREEEFRFYMDDLKAKALITLPDDAPAAHAAAGDDVLRLALEGRLGSYSLAARRRRGRARRRPPTPSPTTWRSCCTPPARRRARRSCR